MRKPSDPLIGSLNRSDREAWTKYRTQLEANGTITSDTSEEELLIHRREAVLERRRKHKERLEREMQRLTKAV
ncbi:hypothetical protein NU768_000858 [Vibrio vulnificus]|nr:hypothetical protein [Vibrio vulnificus]